MLARFHPIMLLGVMETGVLYLRMDSKLTGKRDEPPPLLGIRRRLSWFTTKSLLLQRGFGERERPGREGVKVSTK